MEQEDLNKHFVLERLFIGFMEELSTNSTIDSYRAKSASARSVLKELYQVLADWKDKKIKSPDTVMVIRDELADFIETDEHLRYGKISKPFFQDLLKELKVEDGKKEDSKTINIVNIQQLQYNLYYLLTINKEYHIDIIKDIEKCIFSTYNDEQSFVLAQKALNKYCSLLTSDLLNSGYSKTFIRTFIKTEFDKSNSSNFGPRWEKFKEVFSYENQIDYIVVFKLFVNIEKVLDADFGQMKESIESLKEKYRLNENTKLSKFLDQHGLDNFIPIETKALDRFQAANNARKKLTIILDIIHLIYPHSAQSINSQVLVINTYDHEDAHLLRPNPQVDNIQANSETYSSLISKLTSIRENNCVLEEVSDKLYSCVKHLRLATEADEMEQKFLNCWIGLENIFANYNIDSSTFKRIKQHLVNAHLVSYIKRNIHNLHKTLTKSTIRKRLPLFDKDDITYLTDIQTYDAIIALESYYPLIAYRARYLKSVLFNGKRRVTYIEKHKQNLERHIVRMYRIRNEIVHDARSSYQLDTIYANLRYYLTFILSKCVEFFSDCQPKPIELHKISIDDFFSYQESILKSLKKHEYGVATCVCVPHSVDLFI
ncbi:hypothetical protein [Hymenobacter latericus]|uniref:hypothetical protein n=1 Tax=Hymenobacter sp. YIM 151858-1 TaxID=2987688 RepID=UPI0022276DA7|nr:hypothetical protein [Hymenobacter sp. YIM 151858-1]UYZ58233.1 hypothetical protein OIS50_14350 [Hymenobacter sp. YIM 151858-1]